MIYKIVDLLITLVDDVAFSDVVAGIAKPVKVRVGDLVKTIPAYFNHNKDLCKGTDYVNLVPNNKYRSIIYFEDNGITLEQTTANYSVYNANIRLVLWVNYKTVDLSDFEHDTVISDIITRIPANYGNYDNISRIQFKLNNILNNSTDIFYKYSYDEVDNQYLTYPYYAVAFDYTATFTVMNNCLNEVILNPSECLR